jgi:HSP20 family protein
LFENCVRRYIMVVQKRVRSRFEGTGREGGVRIMLSPFRGFYDAQSEVDRLFNETFGSLSRGRGRQGGQQLAQWAPAVDVLTEDDDLVIRAELPGLKQEDVDITLQNGVLTISGEHKVDEQEERGNYHVRERRYGSFRRSMTLPEGTDESKVHARFEDGVLEVRVEGAAIEQAPKRIEIEGSSG